MTRIPKTLPVFVLQGHYGRWEDLTAEDSASEIKARLREYIDNEGGRYRVVRRRVPNPAYDEPPAPAARYKVVRSFRDRGSRRVIARDLTLEQAQAHCRDPETSSSTATGYAAVRRTATYGPWRDGYEQQ